MSEDTTSDDTTSDDTTSDDTTSDDTTSDDTTSDDTTSDDINSPSPTNDGQQFDRLPETPADREVDGRASRHEVLDWWTERFGIDRSVFAEYSFWEKGAGKVWIFNGEATDPSEVEAIGMTFLRTRQEHWKPTSRAVTRFGHHATKCVIELDPEQASRFVAGEDQDIPEWDGDWGYLIATHEIAGGRAPIGVGLYLYDELRSVVPKGSRADLPVVE